VRVEGGKLRLDRLGRAAEPELMAPFRQLVAGMLPRVDFPELLLEVAELTGLPDAFSGLFRPGGRRRRPDRPAGGLGQSADDLQEPG
jgi:hypothetical protein